MQFNPACLSAQPQLAPSPSITPNNVSSGQSNEFVPNNNISYSDPSTQQNGWSNVPNMLGFPFYGIYNSSLVAVPATEATHMNIPVVSPTINSSADANKKKIPKRPSESDNKSADDKSQSMDDEQKMKRQRRLLKNREAAQQFRQRQKEYIQNLERKVTELNSHVGETHKHIELLTTENRLLRDQLVYLYNVMRQNLSLSPAPTSPTAASPAPFSSPFISSVPTPPAPPASVDLGLLGFKGFGVLDNSTPGGYEEMLKSASPSLQQMMAQLAPTTPSHSQPPSAAASPAITPLASPITPRIPDLGTLSIAKGFDIDACDMSSNPMLMARFGSLISKPHDQNEAQTVPELAIKAEGGGNM